ncbi:XRE family transcriptional regulator [Streptomyces collinus]|uniref:XRE family transcriptional regulator n=1 Tax=Streptomyces collinus TaxID=42684 RepID=UPI0036BC4190
MSKSPTALGAGERPSLSTLECSAGYAARLVVERPEWLSMKILMALLDTLACTMDNLIEPMIAAGAGSTTRMKPTVGAESSVGELRPKLARIRGVERP